MPEYNLTSFFAAKNKAQITTLLEKDIRKFTTQIKKLYNNIEELLLEAREDGTVKTSHDYSIADYLNSSIREKIFLPLMILKTGNQKITLSPKKIIDKTIYIEVKGEIGTQEIAFIPKGGWGIVTLNNVNSLITMPINEDNLLQLFEKVMI